MTQPPYLLFSISSCATTLQDPWAWPVGVTGGAALAHLRVHITTTRPPPCSHWPGHAAWPSFAFGTSHTPFVRGAWTQPPYLLFSISSCATTLQDPWAWPVGVTGGAALAHLRVHITTTRPPPCSHWPGHAAWPSFAFGTSHTPFVRGACTSYHVSVSYCLH